jgi:hypothetical protein
VDAVVNEGAVARALLLAWCRINHQHFQQGLRSPTFALADSGPLGTWSRADRTITLSRRLLHEQPWLVVVEVLRHEVAHQYVDEVLHVRDETAHGPAFRQVCARLAIDARAAGAPQPSDDRVMRRVERLLALAASPNPHEAEQAMRTAQRLMLEHNLEAAPTSYSFRQVGRPVTRITEALRRVAGILGQHFFVQCIWVPAYDVRRDAYGRALEAMGTPENLEMAAWVWDFLLGTAERLWLAERRRGLTGAAAKNRFVAGVLRGFDSKLAESKQEHQEAGLVWLGDPGVKRFYGQRYPSTRRIRAAGSPVDDAARRGFAVGREIVLHRPVSGEATSRGRLLEGG